MHLSYSLQNRPCRSPMKNYLWSKSAGKTKLSKRNFSPCLHSTSLKVLLLYSLQQQQRQQDVWYHSHLQPNYFCTSLVSVLRLTGALWGGILGGFTCPWSRWHGFGIGFGTSVCGPQAAQQSMSPPIVLKEQSWVVSVPSPCCNLRITVVKCACRQASQTRSVSRLAANLLTQWLIAAFRRSRADEVSIAILCRHVRWEIFVSSIHHINVLQTQKRHIYLESNQQQKDSWNHCRGQTNP